MSHSYQNTSPERPDPSQHRTGTDIIVTITAFILEVCSLLFLAVLIANGMLCNKYLLLCIAAVLLIVAGYAAVRKLPRIHPAIKPIFAVLALVLSAAMVWAGLIANSLRGSLDNLTGNLSQTDNMAIIVMADNNVKKLEDMDGYSFGYTNYLDRDDMISQVGKLKNALFHFYTCPQPSLTSMVDSLYRGDCDAIILNLAYLQLLEGNEDYSDFETKTRVVDVTELSGKIQKKKHSGDIPKPFLVYCGGLAVNGDTIPERSDTSLNLLAVVNPSSRQILLVNTPSQYYIPLASNTDKDKLCHAAIYGIKAPADALRWLYNIERDCYCIHLDVSALTDVVDALGGIDINCEQAFTGAQSFSFTPGPSHLNGAEALAYFSELSAFQDGGNQSARNQSAVIQGILEKTVTLNRTSDMKAFFDSLSDSCLTNIRYGEIADLIQRQQENPQEWQVSSYTVYGSMDSTYCFSYPDRIQDVLQPDFISVFIARRLIAQVLSGEVPAVPSR